MLPEMKNQRKRMEILKSRQRGRFSRRCLAMGFLCWCCMGLFNFGLAQTVQTSAVGASNRVPLPTKNSPTGKSATQFNKSPSPNQSFVTQPVVSGTLTPQEAAIQRQAMTTALEIAASGNAWGGGSAEQTAFTTRTSRQAQEQAKRQPFPTFEPKKEKLKAQKKRKNEVLRQREEYEQKIRINFQRFQKIRYAPPHYNGMSSDFSGYNQSFKKINRR